MDLISLVTREEPIGGLEISETAVRLAFRIITKKGKGPSTTQLMLIESPLPPETIKDGRILNSEALSRTLSLLFKEHAVTTRFFVVAIPNEAVYIKTLTFPNTVPELRVTEAVRLALPFQLPWDTETAYTDHELLAGTALKREALVVSAKRAVVDEYLLALRAANITAVAMESSAASVVRALSLPETPIILELSDKTATALIVAEHGAARFVRTLPHTRVNGLEAIELEATHLADFAEQEYGTTPAILHAETLNAKEDIETKILTETPPYVFLGAIGASLRGKLPRNEDHFASVLPLNTSTLYEYERAAAFARFARNIIVGAALFFIIAYVGALILFMYVQTNYARTAVSLSAQPTQSGALDAEARARELNEFLGITSAIVRKTLIPSKILETLKDAVGSGVRITGFALAGIDSGISLTGTATTRPELTAFKKKIETLPFARDVVLPLTNLEQRTDIPFTLSFQFKDPEQLYFPAQNIAPKNP